MLRDPEMPWRAKVVYLFVLVFVLVPLAFVVALGFGVRHYTLQALRLIRQRGRG